MIGTRNALFLALASLGATPSAFSAPEAASQGRSPAVTGREAIAAVRHDWKMNAHHTVGALAHVHVKQGVGPIPANFNRLSPESRLAYLLARHDEDPARFDHYHRHLSPYLERDERLRAAQSLTCMPVTGLIPDNAHSRYLQYRRNLDPVRFDFYHATIGAILAEDNRLRSAVGCVSPQLIPPPGSVGGIIIPGGGTPSAGPPTGGGPGPRSVPEPGSLVLVAIGAVGAVSSRFFRRSKADANPVS